MGQGVSTTISHVPAVSDGATGKFGQCISGSNGGNGFVFQKDAEVAAQRFNMFQSGDHSSNGYGSKPWCPRYAKIAG